MMMVWEALLRIQMRKEGLVQKLFFWDAVPVVLGRSPRSDAVRE
jgi:hypothetical protein